MATETELKLQLKPTDLPLLLAHPLLADATPAERLWNTYFDTPDLALKTRRMAVRERLAGEVWLLTVKTAGSSAGGVSRRREWEGLTTPGALNFAALVDDATLAAELMALRPALRPLFATDFARRRWVLNHAGAQVEVALDEGTVSVPGTALSEPLLELEWAGLVSCRAARNRASSCTQAMPLCIPRPGATACAARANPFSAR